MSNPGIETRTPLCTLEKETFEQLVQKYSKHLQVQIRHSYLPLGFSLGVCLQNGYSEEENVRYAQQMA
jgi:hypothetical protein